MATTARPCIYFNSTIFAITKHRWRTIPQFPSAGILCLPSSQHSQKSITHAVAYCVSIHTHVPYRKRYRAKRGTTRLVLYFTHFWTDASFIVMPVLTCLSAALPIVCLLCDIKTLFSRVVLNCHKIFHSKLVWARKNC